MNKNSRITKSIFVYGATSAYSLALSVEGMVREGRGSGVGERSVGREVLTAVSRCGTRLRDVTPQTIVLVGH
jgi:hypothetical protein